MFKLIILSYDTALDVLITAIYIVRRINSFYLPLPYLAIARNPVENYYDQSTVGFVLLRENNVE